MTDAMSSGPAEGAEDDWDDEEEDQDYLFRAK